MADDPWAEFRVAQQAPVTGAAQDMAAVDPWADFRQPDSPAKTALGLAKAAGTGLINATSGIAGTFGDTAQRPEPLRDMMASKLAGYLGTTDPTKDPNFNAPSPIGSEAIKKGIEENVTGPLHVAQTGPEKVVQGLAEFTPGLMFGPGSIARRAVTQVAAPALASEGGKYLAQGTPYESAAGMAGALMGGAAASSLTRPGTEALLAEAFKGANPQQVQDATRRMQQAQALGMPITWPEAIQEASGGATGASNTMRYIEGTPQGKAVTGPFFAGRPAQAEAAIGGAADAVAPNVMPGSAVGPRAAQAATGGIQRVEGAINQSTRPLYDAAKQQPIPQADFARIAADPSYQAGLRELRNHPELGPTFNNLPDNSIGMIDAVKKLLRDRADVNPMTADATEKYLASRRGNAATEAGNVTTVHSPEQAQAVAEQAAARQQYLEPLQNGPLGAVAGATDTQGALGGLFPKNPVANTAGVTSDSVRLMAQQNPDAAANLIRQQLETTFAGAMKANPDRVATRFANDLIGNPISAENLQAAVRALPNGDRIWQQVNPVLETARATRWRQAQGSPTQPNMLMQEQMSGGGGPAGAVVQTVTRPLATIGDKYQQFRHGKSADEMAQFLLDPSRGQDVGRYAAGGPLVSDWKRNLLIQSLMGGMR